MIDPAYQLQLRELHGNKKRFDQGRKTYRIVKDFLRTYRPATVLDFGCSHGGLMSVINQEHPDMATTGYDPGVPEYQHWTGQLVDAVISIDAIEHIEPQYLTETLIKINSVMQMGACFRIACYPAKKFLPDGRNCHLIVQHPDWWRQQLLTHMQVSIAKETVSVVDQRHKWSHVVGHNYDVVLIKKP